jgi:hypothetical protein
MTTSGFDLPVDSVEENVTPPSEDKGMAVGVPYGVTFARHFHLLIMA